MNVFQNLPLNKAHLHERKAEQCILKNDKDGAIKHYELASSCITQAMKQNYSLNCLFPLSLQNDYYVKCKGKCEESKDDAAFQEKTESPLHSKSVIANVPQTCVKSDQSKLSDQSNQVSTKTFYYNKGFDQEPDSMLRPLHCSFPNVSENRSKRPKSDKDIIEELKMQNNSSKNLVQELMNEKEELQNKCTELEIRNKELLQLLVSSSNLPEENFSSLQVHPFQFDKST